MTMASPGLIERRRDRRLPATGRLSGMLKTSEDFVYNFFLVDVSRDGLGLLLDANVPPDTIMTLSIANIASNPIKLKVRWTIKIAPSVEAYRSGLQVVNADIDLIALLSGIDSVKLEDLG
jgi:hypothetical protein